MNFSQQLTALIESATPANQISLIVYDTMRDITEIERVGNFLVNPEVLERQTIESLRITQRQIYDALQQCMDIIDSSRKTENIVPKTVKSPVRNPWEITASVVWLETQVKQQVRLIVLAKVLQAVNKTIEIRTN
jgi:hypothetical protein